MALDLSKLKTLSDLAKSAVIADHAEVERVRTAGKRTKLAKPMRYARPSMKEVVDRGAGSGLWTGSQPIDSVLANQPLRHNRGAMKLARKGGTLNLADWDDEDLELWLKTIGRRNARLLEHTRVQNLDEHCPRHEQMEAIEEARRALGWTEERLEQDLRILRSRRHKTNNLSA